jgi:syntaxin-binding protein 1
LEAIRSVNPPARWKILVVDDFSQKLLSAVLKQFDVLEENVTRALLTFCNKPFSPVTELKPVIESISSNRDPQPEFEAMYLLMPTTHNVNRIIKDFTNHRQYAAAHLFFIEGDSFSFTFAKMYSNFLVMKDSLSLYSNI